MNNKETLNELIEEMTELNVNSYEEVDAAINNLFGGDMPSFEEFSELMDNPDTFKEITKLFEPAKRLGEINNKLVVCYTQILQEAINPVNHLALPNLIVALRFVLSALEKQAGEEGRKLAELLGEKIQCINFAIPCKD